MCDSASSDGVLHTTYSDQSKLGLLTTFDNDFRSFYWHFLYSDNNGESEKIALFTRWSNQIKAVSRPCNFIWKESVYP